MRRDKYLFNHFFVWKYPYKQCSNGQLRRRRRWRKVRFTHRYNDLKDLEEGVDDGEVKLELIVPVPLNNGELI